MPKPDSARPSTWKTLSWPSSWSSSPTSRRFSIKEREGRAKIVRAKTTLRSRKIKVHPKQLPRGREVRKERKLQAKDQGRIYLPQSQLLFLSVSTRQDINISWSCLTSVSLRRIKQRSLRCQ